MKALYIAASGMAAQERNVEVISNNIANMRTTGYKRQRAEFQDLLYQTYRRAGSLTSDSGTQVPAGIEIGSGVKTATTARIMSQGNVAPTQKELDVAIRGEGLFVVNLPDGRTGYTRDGSFQRDNTGKLVTIDGYEIQPGIVIPGARFPSPMTGWSRPRWVTTLRRQNWANCNWPASSTRRGWRPSGAICSWKPPPAARPRSGCPREKGLAGCFRGTWSWPTSMPLPKLPI